jgi:hypothetical protein
MEPGDCNWDLFIAHGSADKTVAESLYSLLARDARVFLDSKCLKPGDDWDRELSRAQRSARITVVLVSPATDRAYYEREEIAAAIAMARENDQRHRVVPVYLDAGNGHATDIPYGLRLKLGLTAGVNRDLTSVAGQLLGLLERPQSEVPTPASQVTPPGPPAPAGPQYDTGAIRKLLTAALSDESLGELCMDHFPVVYDQFSTAMPKNQKIQRLIEHCARHLEFARLLELIRQTNPAAFAAYSG